MTICLRHDCILTERDERVGVKGHGRAPARTQQHVDKSARGAWVEQTPTTNMCHSINRLAHHAALPIIFYLVYFFSRFPAL